LPLERLLGSSVLTVGFIAGIAEATANITKIFSGALSDWLAKRKLLAAIGYSFCRLHQAGFSAGDNCGLGDRSAFHRSHWKRYPGRAPRAATRYRTSSFRHYCRSAVKGYRAASPTVAVERCPTSSHVG
jgi:hypothetical protein